MFDRLLDLFDQLFGLDLFSRLFGPTGQQPSVYYSVVGLSSQLPSGLGFLTWGATFADVFGVFLLHPKATFGCLLAIDLVASCDHF